MCNFMSELESKVDVQTLDLMLVEIQLDFVQRRRWEHVHLVPYSHKTLKQTNDQTCVSESG